MSARIENGLLLCDCDDFLNPKGRNRRGHPKHCQHTDQLRREQLLSVEAIGDVYQVLAKSHKDDKRIEKRERLCSQLFVDFEHLVAGVDRMDPSHRYQAALAIEKARFKLESAILIGACPKFQERFQQLNRHLHKLIMESYA